MEEHKEEEKIHSKKKRNLTESFRENPWIVSTFVLGVFALILIVTSFTGGITGGTISADDAGESLINYLNSVGYSGFEIKDINKIGDLYEINTLYEEEAVPFYVTKTGYIIGNSLISILNKKEEPVEAESQEIPKSDKPVVGLYIWSYCPYGVTALGPFAQVESLLEDYADFKVYLYYAGHGDFEVQQNKIQACMQDLGENSYWAYAEKFATQIYGKCSGDIDCDLKESVALMKSLGIDSDKVLACVQSDGESLLEEHYNSAKDFGVTGSPSLVVNGVKVSVSRTAEAYKDAICSAFNNAPEECGQTLDSIGTTASGSC